MFVAMNRFEVASGRTAEFEAIWTGRKSLLATVPGFLGFHLLRGRADGTSTLYASHSVWTDAAAFEAWTRSEAFRTAHAGAGTSRDVYLAPPVLELFESVEGA